MSRQKMGLFSTLATVSAVGAAAGIAWRWAQRHRGAGPLAPRELTRWEGEGGALASAGEPGAQDRAQDGASAPAMSGRAGVESSNGATEKAWPFPHGTRH